MEFDFSLQNIADAHGIALSLIGMAIVFAGLAIISVFIVSVPKVLDQLDGIFKGKKSMVETATVKATIEDKDEEAILVAIAAVLDRELRRPDGSDPLRLTMQRTDPSTFWGRAGRMRTLSQR